MADIKGTYAAGTATINANTNIGFKLGLESKLKDASFSAVNGVFYLTSDTHRLFIGNADGSVSPVNQGVINVDDLQTLLNSSNAIPGQFYYAADKNILATYNGTQWVQINPDTQVTGAAITTSAGTNAAVIGSYLTQEGGNHTTERITSNDITIKGANDIVVTVDTTKNEITITDADYSFSTTGNANDVKFNLVRDPADGDAAVEDSITFKGDKGIQVTQSDNVITIDAGAALDDLFNQEIVSAEFSNNATQGFDLTLLKNNAPAVVATLDPVVKYGNGENKASANYINGAATLNVYTIDEINAKMAGLEREINALTYKGTVGTGASKTTLPTSEVKIGDVYMSNGYYTDDAGNTAAAGTLFIATGKPEDEGLDGYLTNITWTQVENYNTDTITSVTMSDAVLNTISFSNSVLDGSNPGGTTFLGSFKVSTNSEAEHPLTTEWKKLDTDGKEREVIITHEKSGYTHDNLASVTDQWNKEGDVSSSVLFRTTDVLGSIGVSDWGHVTSTANYALEIPTEVFDENLSDAATPVVVSGAAQSKMTGTLSSTLALKNAGTGARISKQVLETKVTSETLTLAADNGALKMDLMWGTF